MSTYVHLHGGEVASTRELVELIDRFLDGAIRYDLEWDDFISWPSSNSHVEAVRSRLEEYEHCLFSPRREDRAKYIAKVIEERDQLAALLGMKKYSKPFVEAADESISNRKI